MAPKLSRDSLQATFAHCQAQLAQGSAPGASVKLARDNSETASDKQGKKKATTDVVDLEIMSMR